MSIPNKVTTPYQSNYIPYKVGELPEKSEPEGQPYIISFQKYNNNLCEILNLSGSKGKKALEHIRDIGMKIKSFPDFAKNNLRVYPVRKEGEYLKLFNKLSDDIDIKELKFGDSERIFFFTIESSKMLYIVAIKANHFETKKVRR